MNVGRATCDRRGATAVAVVIFLPILVLFVGFSVDLAYMQLVRAELRAATDLAAKAASFELADTGDTAMAIAKGKQIANANLVAGQGLTLDDSDFVFGSTSRSGANKWVFTPNASPTNAVQVQGRRTSSSPDNEVNLFFTGLLSGNNFAPTASATASFINVDICLVLDRSSSMKLAVSDPATTMGGGDPRECDVPHADSRWMALDTAISLFLAKMNITPSAEQVAVVTFASDYTACSTKSKAVTVNQSLTTNLASISSAMSSLRSTVWNGMTETSAGMSKGRNELNGKNGRDTAQKIMIVLTDGAYTDGIHPSGEAAAAAGNGIQVHTITFGSCPASVIADMQQTAAAGGGNHYHAPDASTLNDVFSDIAGSIAILTE